MILIGSRALLLRASHLLNRKPLDFDFIASEDEAKLWLKRYNIENFESIKNKIIAKQDPPCEFEIIEDGKSSKIFENLVKNDSETLETKFGLVPNLDLLFTLKASHKYLKNSPHFWKTVRDYHCLKSNGAIIKPEYLEFFKLREQETYANQIHPKLNVKSKDFFNGDQVVYIFNHDDIHESVKLNDKPAYLYYLKEGSEVQTDKAKFFGCDNQIRLSGAIEEACVLAIERSLVPYPDKLTPKQAWFLALSKVCSSVTSGYFREWCYNNIFEIIKLYPEDYYEKFQDAVENGEIRPYEKC